MADREWQLTKHMLNNSLPDHLQDPAADPEQIRRDPKMYLFAGHSKR